MKRDMDLIREIALVLRDSSGPISAIEGIDPAVFAEHVHLMQEQGLVEAKIGGGFPTPIAIAFRLTWDGHEFADAVQADTVWAKAKEKVFKPSASWTFGVLKEWLAAEIREGFPTLR